jgi:hypothetical protein
MENALRVVVALGRGQFGNPERRTSTVGSRYQRTGVGQQTQRTQSVYSEMHSVRNRVRL